ncbi:c-type cytochrome [Psychrobacter sp. I-STPA6b]|uniref:c-type cytochrome n=1 Tax=Psychrobacter sp. I-STPA6b TaxID=2585718 RepID=UPI001D0C790F|nr:c-type cytochrome [Psychrobacter sp. I-STPA6b]
MKYVTISVMFSLSLMLSACSDSQEAAQTSKTETTQPEQTTVQQNEAQQNDSEVQNTEEVSEATPEQPESKDDVAKTDTSSEQESSEPVEVAKEAPQLDANAGKELYEKQCKICHESGMLGAPKYGNQSEWASHIAKGKDTLYLHSAKGFNKMPPQAVNGVTEAQVQAAVDYMVAGSS